MSSREYAMSIHSFPHKHEQSERFADNATSLLRDTVLAEIFVN